MHLLQKLIIIVILFVPSIVVAQKLEYREFKVTNEATARLHGSSMTDENSGKKAALIKIYTPFLNDVLGFDAGLFQILGRKQAGPGEVWLYVPERTQKVTVTHPNYNPVEIWFDGMEAESGKTYSVILNVEGRNVALIASRPHAEIFVDGESQGKSPVNIRLSLGSHEVRAESGTFLYDDIINVSQDGPVQFNLHMEDESLKYGNVDIEVAGNAELWIENKCEGTGSVSKNFKEGTYKVVAKLPDHYDQITSFTVEAGKNKTVIATPPLAHMGYIDIYTDPAGGVAVTRADSVFELVPNMIMPVDDYNLKFTKKGYYPKNIKFRLQRNQTYNDTIRLKRIQYVKKSSGYLTVSFGASGSPSLGVAIGGYIENVNIETSYNLGLGMSKDVEWYDRTDQVYEESYNYSKNEMGVKLGYQFRYAERFSITPQFGYMIQKLAAKDKSYPGNGFSQGCVTIGGRLTYNPFQHIGFVIAPEYGIPIGSTGDILEVFKQGGMTRGGIKASIGVSISL